MENLKAKLLNDIVKSNDYLKSCLLIAKAMKLEPTVKDIDGDELVFLKGRFCDEQFIPTIDMDQNIRVFNWLCEHGTLTFCGEWATLNVENEVFRSHGEGGLFRQASIFSLAVQLSVFLNQ